VRCCNFYNDELTGQSNFRREQDGQRHHSRAGGARGADLQDEPGRQPGAGYRDALIRPTLPQIRGGDPLREKTQTAAGVQEGSGLS